MDGTRAVGGGGGQIAQVRLVHGKDQVLVHGRRARSKAFSRELRVRIVTGGCGGSRAGRVRGEQWIPGGHLGACDSSWGERRAARTRAEDRGWGARATERHTQESLLGTAGWTWLSPVTGTLEFEQCGE